MKANVKIYAFYIACFVIVYSTISFGAPPSGYFIPQFVPPRHMDLCGEPVPLFRDDVWERFDREFTIVVYSHAQVFLWLKRAERYFPWLEKTLKARGLPDDLKYLVIAESDLLHTARSPAGATGPWQFIKSTARKYGLRIGNGIDERYDFEKSTEKALNYLQNLYNQFQSWALAMAAYNCGEERIAKELRDQRVTSYYDLKLPTETERYIFRILAIKEVLSHPEKYGYEFKRGDGYKPRSFEKTVVFLKYPLPIVDVAQAADLTMRDFVLLNPSYRSRWIPAGTHEIRLPVGYVEKFSRRISKLEELYAKKTRYYIVKKGDTLSSIARRYKISVSRLRRLNGLKSNKIFVGQRLRIE